MSYNEHNMLSHFKMEIVKSRQHYVKMEMAVDERMAGPNGKVSGGLIAALAETAASVGANETITRDELAFCAQINTDFLSFPHVTRIEAEARLVHDYPSPTQQLWEVQLLGNRQLMAKSSCLMSIKTKR